MRPIRLLRTASFRIAALYAAMFGLSVLILFGIIYWIADEALRQQLETSVRTEVAALMDDYQTGGLEGAIAEIRQRIASGPRAAPYYLLQDRSAQRLAGNLPPMAPNAGWSSVHLSASDRNATDEGAADLQEHYILGLGRSLPNGVFLFVGEDAHRVNEAEEAIVQAVAWAFGAMLLLAVAGGSLLSVGFLRRIDDINNTARAIVRGALSDRVPTRGTNDELDRLAANLNEMLDSIQALMESLRQVSSDIAHDLRTPLSRLRQRLEAARLSAHSVADYEAAVDQALSDVETILSTFTALLSIAQIEAGTRRSSFSMVDLSEIFSTVGEAYGAVAEDLGHTLVLAIANGITCCGDRELLVQMLANLVENAIHHTPPPSTITVSLEPAAAGPLGSVADNGPGIPEAEHARVFRRFYRMDASRTTPGSGLGLALVGAIADLHRINIKLTDNAPGLKVVLRFPPPSAD